MMAFSELKKIRGMEKEIIQLDRELIKIKNRQSFYRSPQLDGMPHGGTRVGSAVESMAIEMTDATRALMAAIEQLSKQKAKVIEYIESIDDYGLRWIVIARHVRGLTWEQIADEYGAENSAGIKRYYFRHIYDYFDKEA